jgi:alanine-alpha-ketoisovalerate/valine-pyruvate aminotransferase
MTENKNVTVNHFLVELKKRVSASNAKLLLDSAVVRTGINCSSDAPLNSQDAHALCMELIKNGGPGFQVGRAVYTEYIRQ